MTLCDAGPLVALIDAKDPHHDRCVAAAESLPPEPLVTTWPCWAEAMYLIGQTGGFPAQQRLWRLLRVGTVRLHVPAEAESDRMEVLMERYRDAPMDLGDASARRRRRDTRPPPDLHAGPPLPLLPRQRQRHVRGDPVEEPHPLPPSPGGSGAGSLGTVCI